MRLVPGEAGGDTAALLATQLLIGIDTGGISGASGTGVVSQRIKSPDFFSCCSFFVFFSFLFHPQFEAVIHRCQPGPPARCHLGREEPFPWGPSATPLQVLGDSSGEAVPAQVVPREGPLFSPRNTNVMGGAPPSTAPGHGAALPAELGLWGRVLATWSSLVPMGAELGAGATDPSLVPPSEVQHQDPGRDSKPLELPHSPNNLFGLRTRRSHNGTRLLCK